MILRAEKRWIVVVVLALDLDKGEREDCGLTPPPTPPLFGEGKPFA